MKDNKLKDRISQLEDISEHMSFEWDQERELYTPEMWERFYKQKVDMIIKNVNIEKLREIHRPLMNITGTHALNIASMVEKEMLKSGYIVKTSVSTKLTAQKVNIIDVYYVGKVEQPDEDEEEHTKLIGLNMVKQNKFLHNYEAIYQHKDGSKKVYEVISRNPKLNLKTFGKTDRLKSDAVGIIMFNTDRDKILLQKEFRMACGEWVYNFPGGLIDLGETAKEAAKRELKEETGLDLQSILYELPPAYTAVGLGNESVTTIIGVADGEFSESTSVDEEIIPAWYTKKEILELIDNKKAMSLRTQSFLYMWAIS